MQRGIANIGWRDKQHMLTYHTIPRDGNTIIFSPDARRTPEHYEGFLRSLGGEVLMPIYNGPPSEWPKQLSALAEQRESPLIYMAHGTGAPAAIEASRHCDEEGNGNEHILPERLVLLAPHLSPELSPSKKGWTRRSREAYRQRVSEAPVVTVPTLWYVPATMDSRVSDHLRSTFVKGETATEANVLTSDLNARGGERFAEYLPEFLRERLVRNIRDFIEE